MSTADKLRELDDLLAQGVISRSEYALHRDRIIGAAGEGPLPPPRDPTPPPSWLIWNIANGVLSLACCLVPVIPAVLGVVFGQQVKDLAADGDMASACRNSRTALIWAILGTFAGTITLGFIAFTFLLGASA